VKVLTQNLGETLGVKVAPNLAETESCRQLLAGRVQSLKDERFRRCLTCYCLHTPFKEGGTLGLLTQGLPLSLYLSWSKHCTMTLINAWLKSLISLSLVPTPGQIDGQSDVHELMCFLCDPNSRCWRGNVPPTNGQGCTCR